MTNDAVTEHDDCTGLPLSMHVWLNRLAIQSLDMTITRDY